MENFFILVHLLLSANKLRMNDVVINILLVACRTYVCML